MTTNELVQRALRQLNAGQPRPHVWPESEIDLAACVMQAISEVAHTVMRDDALRPLLQQEYVVTLDGSGEGDLLAAVGSITGVAGEILIDGVRFGAVLDLEGQKLHPILHYADFVAPQATVFGYYTIKDKATILTRARDIQVNTALDIQSANGPLTITANFAPASVANIPPELEDVLVHSLVRIVSLKTNADA